MSWKILVTARAFWTSGQAAEAALRAADCDVVRSSLAGPVPEDELIAQLGGCQAVIASSDPYTARVFAECPDLRVVSRCGVGFDSVDLAAATAAGVIVTNTPGAMADAVADYAFGLMLAIARRIVESDALMRDGGWGEFPGVLVCGKTLGLVGAGMIGQGVARRAAGFGMRVLAYDPPLAAALPSGLPPMEFVTLEELLGESDFVSVHAPNMPETQRMFNAARFAQMRPTAYLINTARGALIDEAALLHALEKGQIAGAALDVFEREPLAVDHPLRRSPRCILTSHNAFNTAESAAEMSRISAENVLAVMRGERPATIVNQVKDSRADGNGRESA